MIRSTGLVDHAPTLAMDNRTSIHLMLGSPTDSGFFEGGRWVAPLQLTAAAGSRSGGSS